VCVYRLQRRLTGNKEGKHLALPFTPSLWFPWLQCIPWGKHRFLVFFCKGHTKTLEAKCSNVYTSCSSTTWPFSDCHEFFFRSKSKETLQPWNESQYHHSHWHRKSTQSQQVYFVIVELIEFTTAQRLFNYSSLYKAIWLATCNSNKPIPFVSVVLGLCLKEYSFVKQKLYY
jgi:hypothetical protein